MPKEEARPRSKPYLSNFPRLCVCVVQYYSQQPCGGDKSVQAGAQISQSTGTRRAGRLRRRCPLNTQTSDRNEQVSEDGTFDVLHAPLFYVSVNREMFTPAAAHSGSWCFWRHHLKYLRSADMCVEKVNIDIFGHSLSFI